MTDLSGSAPRVIRFGVFELDLHARELRKAGVRLRLPAQSVEVLTLLLERSGDLVTREELRQRLWPTGTFVDFEHGLNAAVNRLRDTLGDSADRPRFVETMPMRGYRFVAPVARGATVAVAPLQFQRKRRGLPFFERRSHKFLLALTGAAVSIAATALWMSGRTPQQLPRVVPLTTQPGYERPRRSLLMIASSLQHSSKLAQRPDAELYVAEVGSSELRRLTTGSHHDLRPSWSPGGTQIAFLRWDGVQPPKIHLVSPLGGAVTS